MTISTSTAATLLNLAARGNLKALRDLLGELVAVAVGITAGTVAASQAVVVSATKTITGFLSITSTSFLGNLVLPAGTVAAAGTTNADATAITAGYCKVTAGDGTKGAILPALAAGQILIVKNNSASILKVYPAPLAAINALVVTTGGLSMAANTVAIFIGDGPTQVFTLPLLPS